MDPNRCDRRVHSSEFKTRVLAECRQAGASVAGVAIAHGLNPNVVHKWLAGQGLKRMQAATAAPARITPVVQFVPLELAKAGPRALNAAVSLPDIRIELERDGLRLKLRCAASAGPAYAALLRALADAIGVG